MKRLRNAQHKNVSLRILHKTKEVNNSLTSRVLSVGVLFNYCGMVSLDIGLLVFKAIVQEKIK